MVRILVSGDVVHFSPVTGTVQPLEGDTQRHNARTEPTTHVYFVHLFLSGRIVVLKSLDWVEVVGQSIYPSTVAC